MVEVAEAFLDYSGWMPFSNARVAQVWRRPWRVMRSESLGSTRRRNVALTASGVNRDPSGRLSHLAGSKLRPTSRQIVGVATGKDRSGKAVIAVPPGAIAALIALTVTRTEGPDGYIKV